MEYDIKPAASRFHALTVQPEGTVGEFVRSLDVSENSRTTYRKAVLKFLDYLQERGIEAPAAQDILDYKEHMRSLYAANTVNTYLCAVKLFFAYAADMGAYPNVAAKVKKLRVPRDHKKDDFSALQARGILDGIDRDTLQGKRDYAIINTMFRTGLRDI